MWAEAWRERLGAGLLALALSSSAAAQQRGQNASIPLHGMTEESLGEVARQVNNPIGPLWQLTFDNEWIGVRGSGVDGVSYAGSLEPVLSTELDRLGLQNSNWAADFRIVAQLTLPVIETVPSAPGDDRRSGFGDLELATVFAPNARKGVLWGVGPNFVFPSATDSALGQGKWQAGPVALAGYVGKRWTAFAITQQWWSFAGDGGRPSVSQLCVNYALIRNLPRRWQVGLQPTMTVDWKASNGNRISFPIGGGVGRTVRIGALPVQIWLEGDYYPVHPDDVAGPRWGVQLQLSPVISQLF